MGLLAAVLVVYSPVWNGGPLWDDQAHLTRPELLSLAGLWRIWFDIGATQQYYPLLHSTFWALAHFAGSALWPYHLLNIGLHATSAFLFFLILRRLQVPGALVAGGVFALHPIQAESVAWMSELKNVMSGALYFGSALQYLRFSDDRRASRYWVSVALFVAALMTKSVTATLPAALVVLMWWARGRIVWRRDILPLVPFFVVGAASGLLTVWVEHSVVGAKSAYSMTLTERALIAGRAPWFYAAKLLWPVNLSFIYSRWSVSAGDWVQYLFPIASLAVLALAWKLRNYSRAPLAVAVLFLATLAPALGFVNVYPFRYSFVANHFQYLACAAAIAAIVGASALALRRFPNSVGCVVAGLLFGTLGWLTWHESVYYIDSERLYAVTIEREPRSWMAHLNLGALMLESSPPRMREAMVHFREAVRLNPELPEAHYNLALVLNQTGDHVSAEAEYRRTLELDPGHAKAANDLGLLLAKGGRYADAQQFLQRALVLFPSDPDLHNNMGTVLAELQQWDAAIQEFTAAASLRPAGPEAYVNMGNALLASGRISDAISYLERAAKTLPSDADVHTALADALLRAGETTRALEEYATSIGLDSSRPQIFNNVGIALAREGRHAEAIHAFDVALKLNPEYPEALVNRALSQATQGHIDQAIGSLQRALRLDPDDTESRVNMAILLMRRRRYDEAAINLEAVLDRQPENARVRRLLSDSMRFVSLHRKNSSLKRPPQFETP